MKQCVWKIALTLNNIFRPTRKDNRIILMPSVKLKLLVLVFDLLFDAIYTNTVTLNLNISQACWPSSVFEIVYIYSLFMIMNL